MEGFIIFLRCKTLNEVYYAQLAPITRKGNKFFPMQGETMTQRDKKPVCVSFRVGTNVFDVLAYKKGKTK